MSPFWKLSCHKVRRKYVLGWVRLAISCNTCSCAWKLAGKSPNLPHIVWWIWGFWILRGISLVFLFHRFLDTAIKNKINAFWDFVRNFVRNLPKFAEKTSEYFASDYFASEISTSEIFGRKSGWSDVDRAGITLTLCALSLSGADADCVNVVTSQGWNFLYILF